MPNGVDGPEVPAGDTYVVDVLRIFMSFHVSDRVIAGCSGAVV